MKKIDFGFVILIITLFVLVFVSYKLYNIVILDNNKVGAALEKKSSLNKKSENGLIQIDRKAKIKDITTEEPKIEVEEGVTYAAIVVDDIGENPWHANDLLSIGMDFTFSVLPYETHSIEIADNIKVQGHELMLHLPMEPHDYPEKDPGKGVLLLNMTDDEIKDMTNELFDLIPGISGTNNHMGSKFCENCEKMSLVMKAVKERNLYFLDSVTSRDSCISEVAKSHGVRHVSRNVFLDNDKEEEKILAQIDQLINISKKYGYAIAICHPYPETIAALKKARDKFDENSIKITRLSEIIKRRRALILEKEEEKTLSSQSVTR